MEIDSGPAKEIDDTRASWHSQPRNNRPGYFRGRNSSYAPQQRQQPEETVPLRSVEGYVLILRNIHPETTEYDVTEMINEEAQVDIKNLQLNLDRRTGVVKGYCLIQVETVEEGVQVIKALNGFELYEQAIKADWAFVGPPPPAMGPSRQR